MQPIWEPFCKLSLKSEHNSSLLDLTFLGQNSGDFLLLRNIFLGVNIPFLNIKKLLFLCHVKGMVSQVRKKVGSPLMQARIFRRLPAIDILAKFFALSTFNIRSSTKEKREVHRFE